MSDKEWISRCAARLHQQWPTVELDELRTQAWQLSDDARLREQAPEAAAEWWLRQGVLHS